MILRAHDTLTKTVLAEWAPFDYQWEDAYNAPGTLTATIRLDDWLADPAIGPLRTAVQLIDEATNVVAFTGPIWTAKVDLTRRLVQVAAAGWGSVLRRRVNRSDLTYSGVDQAAIAAGLVTEAQRDTVAGGSNHRDLHISVAGVGTTGVTRTRSYPAAERKNIGAALEELAAVDNGFRFSITDTITSGTAFTRALNIHPVVTTTSTVLMAGANVEIPAVDFSAENMVSDADFLSGQARTATTLAAPTAGYPGIDLVTSAQDITEAGTINAYLVRVLADGGSPWHLPTVTIPPADQSEVSVNVGDEVQVVVDELDISEPLVVVGITRKAVAAGITSSLKLVRFGA